MADSGIAYIGPVQLTTDTLPSILAKLDSPPPIVTIDTETFSVKDHTCMGIGVAFSPMEALYLRVLPDPSPYLERYIPVLCNPDILTIFHNALFDLDVLTTFFEIQGWPPIDLSNIGDTSVMGRVQALESSLQALTYQLLGRYIQSYGEMLIEEGGGRKVHPLDIHWSKIANKCLQDCLATYGVYEKLW